MEIDNTKLGIINISVIVTLGGIIITLTYYNIIPLLVTVPLIPILILVYFYINGLLNMRIEKWII